MKKLNRLLPLIFVANIALLLAACSDDNGSEKEKGDHVWKQQTDTLQTSKDAAKKLQESLNQQQKQMDENN
jgi:uncharacterized lipoprotein YehR (DUF1307 family)